MSRFFLTFALVAAGASVVWADCKPRDYYTRSAKIYINPSQGKQNLKRAEELMTEALKCYPKDEDVLYTAGQLFYMKKEFPKMISVLDSAINYYPDFRPVAETLRALAFEDIFTQAYGFLEKGMKAATAQENVKNLRQAINLFMGCMLIDSTATGPYKNLSVAYYALKIPDSSTLYDGLAFKIKPDSARWGYAYAVGLVNQKNYKEAIGVLEKVVEKDTLYWDAWGLLGQLYGAEDRLAKMVSVYEKLSRQYPDSAEFLGQLALYNMRKGTDATTAKEAAPFFQKADSMYNLYLKHNEADSNSWYNWGLALTSLKEYTKAADVLKKATAKFPGFADAYEALSGSYAHMGKAEEAKKAFAMAQKLRGVPTTQK